MERFCPNCGKTVTDKTFCEDCRETTIRRNPVSIKLCPTRRYFYRGSWTAFEHTDEIVERVVRDTTKGDILSISESIEELVSKEGVQKEVELKVKDEDTTIVIPLNINVTRSSYAKKIGGQYYEGILQIRNATSDVKKWIHGFLETCFQKGIIINEIKENGNSVDLFFGNKKDIPKVARKMQRVFGAHIEANASVHTRDHQTQKDVHRVNALVEVPPFKEKDVIEYENKLLYVTRLGKQIKTRKLPTYKPFVFTYSKDKNIPLVEKNRTVVSTLYPNVEVLDPETYQSKTATNPRGISLTEGQKVTVVKKKRLHIIK